MRKFRAIVETHIEPEDHQVLWYYKGKLLYWGNDMWEPFHLVDANEIPYTTEEDESVSNIQEALDKLMYVTPNIDLFTLKQGGVYEIGDVINVLNFDWNYNKRAIKSQKLNNIPLPLSVRQATLNREINRDTTFTLEVSDGTNTISSAVSIEFAEYIYYGTVNIRDRQLVGKISPLNNSLTMTVSAVDYIYIFIPKSLNLTRIWHNGIDTTDTFVASDRTELNSYGVAVPGTLYTSKNKGLNNVTLKFT